jgi:oligoribonuclease (3'-5' exoribonuclease)
VKENSLPPGRASNPVFADANDLADPALFISMVAECLAAEHPSEPEIVEGFKKEQLDGYKSGDVTSSILNDIRYPAAPYDAIKDHPKRRRIRLSSLKEICCCWQANWTKRRRRSGEPNSGA